VSDRTGDGISGEGLAYGLATVQIAGLVSAWHYYRVYRGFPRGAVA
jgi:hypothetical protein